MRKYRIRKLTCGLRCIDCSVVKQSFNMYEAMDSILTQRDGGGVGWGYGWGHSWVGTVNA